MIWYDILWQKLYDFGWNYAFAKITLVQFSPNGWTNLICAANFQSFGLIKAEGKGFQMSHRMFETSYVSLNANGKLLQREFGDC